MGWTAEKLWIWWRWKCHWYCRENNSWLPACSHSFHSPNCPHYETVLLNMLADEKIRVSLWIYEGCTFSIKIQRAGYRHIRLHYIIYFVCILRFLQWLRLCAVEAKMINKLCRVLYLVVISYGKRRRRVMRKVRPRYTSHASRDLISEKRNTKVRNSTHNCCLSVHTKMLFSCTLQYWQYNVLFVPNCKGSFISHKSNCRDIWLCCL